MDEEKELNRDCCLFYKSYFEAGDKLKDREKKLVLLESIFDYGTEGKEPDFFDDALLDMAWTFIKPLLDANIRNYKNGKKNGRKGGAPKGNQNAKKTTQNNPKQPKTTKTIGNVTGTVTVSDTDTDTVTTSNNSKPVTVVTEDPSSALLPTKALSDQEYRKALGMTEPKELEIGEFNYD